MCVPLDHQNGAKMVPRTSKVSQNGDPRTLKGNKNQQHPMTNPATKKLYSKQCSLNFNPGSPSNPANPFSLQISSQLVTRGAGGRGEALGIRRAGAKLQLHGVLGLVLLSPSPVHIHVQCTFSV